jgi:hypothetical protein
MDSRLPCECLPVTRAKAGSQAFFFGFRLRSCRNYDEALPKTFIAQCAPGHVGSRFGIDQFSKVEQRRELRQLGGRLNEIIVEYDSIREDSVFAIRGKL